MRLPNEVMVFLVLSSLLPFARASVLPSDWSHLSDWQQAECENILSDGSLNLDQKEDLYLNLLESQGILPSHGFVFNWNRQLEFSEPPASVVPQSSGIIKDAWARIVSVRKSFFDLNLGEWFVEPHGTVLSASGYLIELPEGTEAGDCQTGYSLHSSSENLSVFVNGLMEGEGQEVGYSTGVANGQEIVFRARLRVAAKLRVDHYKLVEHKFWAGGIFPHYEYYYTCEFDRTEYRDYSVSAEDSFDAITLVAEPSIKVVLEEFSEYRKFKLLVERSELVNEVVFSVGESVFSLSEANFDLNAAVDGISFVERNQKFSRQTKGFDELDFNRIAAGYLAVLGTTSGEACQLTLFTDFEEKQLPCEPIPARQTVLEIETNANVFDSNQQVMVRVRLRDDAGNALSGEKVRLRYGAREKELTTDGQGSAEVEVSAADSMGFFEARFEPEGVGLKESRAVKRASVQNAKAWGTTEQVLGFFGCYYFIFLLIKKKLALGL